MYFQDATIDAVNQGITNARAKADAQRLLTIEKCEDFYEGGPELARKYLWKFPKEKPEKYINRKRRLGTPNPVKRIVDAVVDGLYGGKVQRSLGVGNDADKLLAEILEANEIDTLQEEVGLGEVVGGEGWVNVAWDDKAKMVVLHSPNTCNVEVTWDPYNPRRLAELVERRPNPDRSSPKDPMFVDHVWTPEMRAEVYSDKSYKLPPQPNEYKVIPYSWARGRTLAGEPRGVPYILDAVELMELLINQVSDLDNMTVNTAHRIVWSRGGKQPEVEGGPDRWVHFKDELGQIGAVDQTASLDQVLKVIESYMEWGFQTNGIPISLIKGEQASSGFELVVKYQPFLGVVNSGRRRLLPHEKRVLNLICVIGRAHKMKGLPERPIPTAEWRFSPLPQDVRSDRMEDARLVEQGLLARETYWERHMPELDTPEKRTAYAALVDAEAAKRNAGQQSSLFLPGAPDERNAL